MNEMKSGGAILVMLMTLLIAFVVFSLYGASWMPRHNANLLNIQISDVPLFVEVVNNPEEQKTGLTGRKSLRKNGGMLFIFKESAKWRVTTQYMQFPIDIFWLDKDGRIVSIQKYASGTGSNVVFAPDAPAIYILETNADFASIYNIKVGDYVTGI